MSREKERRKCHVEGMFISSLGIAFLPDSRSAKLHFKVKKRKKELKGQENVRFTLLLYNKVYRVTRLDELLGVASASATYKVTNTWAGSSVFSPLMQKASQLARG